MQLSVVIPTFNRCEILRECLQHLQKQEFVKGEYEIIVVDDGSTDDTRAVVFEFKNDLTLPIIYIHQPNQGQGVARNKGVEQAVGKVIVFIGDDILVRPDFVKQHIEYHRHYIHENQAVLGLVLWDPRVPQTTFNEFMTNGSIFFGRFGGHQFAYEKLHGKEKADFNFFYTSNISLKRSLLLKFPFDPVFSSYGWEDIELGYRLTKEANLELYYNSHAIGYHYHILDPDSLHHRMKAIGKSAHIFHRKFPELRKVPPFWKWIILRLVSNSLSIGLFNRLRKKSAKKFWDYLYYYLVSKRAFLRGVKEGVNRV